MPSSHLVVLFDGLQVVTQRLLILALRQAHRAPVAPCLWEIRIQLYSACIEQFGTVQVALGVHDVGNVVVRFWASRIRFGSEFAERKAFCVHAQLQVGGSDEE